MPSTVIRSFHYDVPSGTLLIVFRSGRRYRYEAVPAELAQAMRKSFSKGEFFNRHIRGSFSFRREDPV